MNAAASRFARTSACVLFIAILTIIFAFVSPAHAQGIDMQEKDADVEAQPATARETFADAQMRDSGDQGTGVALQVQGSDDEERFAGAQTQDSCTRQQASDLQTQDADVQEEDSEGQESQRLWEKTEAGWRYLIGGTPAIGFVEDEGSTYYLDPTTTIMRTGWAKIDDDWFFFAPSGAMHTGWLYDRVWYYLDPAQDGKMRTGKYSDGNALYLSNASGAMYANGWVKMPEGWYYASASGALLTDWLFVGGKWYYLDPMDALMATGSREVRGKTYFLNPNGDMATGWSWQDGSYWRFYDPSGAMCTGWLYDRAWYYLDPAQDGKMRTGKYSDGNALYLSNASGAMYANGWVKMSEGWYYASASGALLTGWFDWHGAWYWLQPKRDGLMIADTRETINGKLYAFTANGDMLARRFIRLDGNACAYAAASGAVTTVGVFVGDKVVLKDKAGKTLTGWQQFGETKFYADKNGVPQTGWLDLNGVWYWLDDDGALATNAWVDGGRYYVGSEGSWRPYGNAELSAKILAAAKTVGFQGSGYCAKWVDCVYMAAGYPHFDGDARDFYWEKCTISDLNLMEPGMVIGVPSHTKSSLGKIYGHVAIYMGDGMVRENLSSVVNTPLSSWLAYYQTSYPAKCGWAI